MTDPTVHDPETQDGWEWAIVEILGRRVHAGRIREEVHLGSPMLRVDVPINGNAARFGWTKHVYSRNAVFSLTLADKARVLAMNKTFQPAAQLSNQMSDDDVSEHTPF